MNKRGEASKNPSRVLVLALLLIWVFVLIIADQIAYSREHPENSLYVMAVYLSISLLGFCIGGYYLEGLKLRDFPWLRILPFLAWLVSFYVLVFWVSTQETLTPLFYLMILGLPFGIVLFGISTYPLFKKYAKA
jgi:cytochrome bd-type quinol oxidase subunit 2